MYTCKHPPRPQRIRQKGLSADAAFQAMICNGGLATCFVDPLGQKIEEKAVFDRRKGTLGLPLPLKIMCSTSSSDFPSLLLLKMQACCYKQGKVFGFFSSVLDTVVHNLYMNYTGINQAVKSWMASKRNA